MGMLGGILGGIFGAMTMINMPYRRVFSYAMMTEHRGIPVPMPVNQRKKRKLARQVNNFNK